MGVQTEALIKSTKGTSTSSQPSEIEPPPQRSSEPTCKHYPSIFGSCSYAIKTTATIATFTVAPNKSDLSTYFVNCDRYQGYSLAMVRITCPGLLRPEVFTPEPKAGNISNTQRCKGRAKFRYLICILCLSICLLACLSKDLTRIHQYELKHVYICSYTNVYIHHRSNPSLETPCSHTKLC